MSLFRRHIIATVQDLQITNLDMSFNVMRSLTREPNTCELNIINLNETNRNRLQERSRLRIKLEVGYAPDLFTEPQENFTLSTIFDGIIEDVATVRDGGDFITTVRTSDGGRRRRRSRTNRSFGPGARVERVLRRLARDLGVGQGNIREAVANGTFENLGQEWANGVALSGNTAQIMSDIVESAGLEWSIQDGNIQILQRLGALRGTAVRLTSNTGLLESPTVDNDGIVKVKTLIIPDLFPGRRLQIFTRDVAGIFRAKRCTYLGDTSSNDWFIETEAEELRASG